MEQYFTNNPNLKSNIRNISIKINDENLSFKSDNGVFSKSSIDYASKFLVETYLKNKKDINNILDIGCGYGFIGIALSRILNIHVDMADINKRAVHLCKMNIDENKVDAFVFESNIYENIDNKYDLIITNPPIRVGKEILLKFLIDGFNHLNNDGELWFVINKNQGAKSIIKEVEKYGICEIIDKSKGFYVVSTKKR